jgi:CcmD family protein
MRRAIVSLATFVTTTALSVATALAVQPPPGGQSEFVPAKDLPPTESIPAAPLLVIGYAIIWVAVAFYLWTIWRRLNTVETELRVLAQKTRKR